MDVRVIFKGALGIFVDDGKGFLRIGNDFLQAVDIARMERKGNDRFNRIEVDFNDLVIKCGIVRFHFLVIFRTAVDGKVFFRLCVRRPQ